MALHERKQLRDAVVAQLIAGATSAGARVRPSRMEPPQTSELPAIGVYTPDEEVTGLATAPRELTRTAVVAIEAWVIAAQNLEDAFDALALQIETAMDTDLWLGGAANTSVLSGTSTGIQLDGARPMGMLRLEYTCVYKTDQRTAAAHAAREDFTTLDTRTNLNGAQATADQAEDLQTDLHE